MLEKIICKVCKEYKGVSIVNLVYNVCTWDGYYSTQLYSAKYNSTFCSCEVCDPEARCEQRRDEENERWAFKKKNQDIWC